MKKIINCFLICSALFLSCSSAGAQTLSPVHISDLNPVTDIDSAMSSTHKVRLTVNFKVDDAAQADSVFFMFGTTPGGSEIYTEGGKFKKTGTDYFVKTQGPSYPIINTEASCKVKVSKQQFNSSTWLSMVVRDKSGLYTNVLHIRIN